MRCISLIVLALCATVALAQCGSSPCQQQLAPTQVLLVPVTQAPSCSAAVQQSTCCKAKTDTCCNKPCYIEPEYKAEECQRRSVSVCCAKPAQTCCNMGCATFLEAKAEVTAETEQCPEIVRVNTCCQPQQTTGCCNPQKTCTPPAPVSKIGDMKMGLLQLPNCTVAVNNRPCCSNVAPVITTCCNQCNRQLVAADLAPTVSSCPAVTAQPCCSTTVTSCCNSCAAPAAAPAPAPALVEAEAESEQCPTCSLAPQKPMVAAKVLGACEQPPCGSSPTVTSTCSSSVRAMTCCKSTTDTCCSKPCTYIGQMQMGKLCDAQLAATTCCTAATSSCCNRQRTC